MIYTDGKNNEKIDNEFNEIAKELGLSLEEPESLYQERPGSNPNATFFNKDMFPFAINVIDSPTYTVCTEPGIVTAYYDGEFGLTTPVSVENLTPAYTFWVKSLKACLHNRTPRTIIRSNHSLAASDLNKDLIDYRLDNEELGNAALAGLITLLFPGEEYAKDRVFLHKRDFTQRRGVIMDRLKTLKPLKMFMHFNEGVVVLQTRERTEGKKTTIAWEGRGICEEDFVSTPVIYFNRHFLPFMDNPPEFKIAFDVKKDKAFINFESNTIDIYTGGLMKERYIYRSGEWVRVTYEYLSVNRPIPKQSTEIFIDYNDYQEIRATTSVRKRNKFEEADSTVTRFVGGNKLHTITYSGADNGIPKTVILHHMLGDFVYIDIKCENGILKGQLVKTTVLDHMLPSEIPNEITLSISNP